MKSDSPRSFLRYLPAPHPASAQIVLVVASLLCVTAMFMPFDVVSCWLPWSFASDGHAPWRIYLTRPDCNYPPFMLYALTLQEAIRKMFGWSQEQGSQLFLVKVPQILAQVAGAILSYYGLRRLFGERYARQACFLYAIALPLFVNAALWGQVDALLALVMVTTILLLMNDKPVLAGIVFGLSLCVKLQAIVIAPVVLLYAFRKYGWKVSTKALGAGLLTIAVLALPFVLMGAGSPLLKAYFGSAGYYPFRTLNALNIWALSYYIAHVYCHIPDAALTKDNNLIAGIITANRLGLLLFAGSLLVLLVKLYRTPTPRMLAWTAANSAFCFFMLCTQMHERYGVPAAALYVLVAPESLWALLICGGINLCAAWNQWLVLLANWQMSYPLTPMMKSHLRLFDISFLVVSAINCLLLMGAFWQMLRGSEPREQPTTTYPPSTA